MMYLILGGSGSGKSAYAEELLFSLPTAGKKYYIATMQALDEESRMRVKKHRMQRAGRQFITLEQPVDAAQAARRMDSGKNSAMLECVSNLVANEMFSVGVSDGKKKNADQIVEEIQKLYQAVEHLVIVSNNVFEDGISYDDMTMEYIRTLGIVNQKLGAMADVVTEVVVGIPVMLKAPEHEKE